VAGREPLEEPTALSESVLWSLQRGYFQREGIRAWSLGVVPEMITTNAFMGATYARVVVSFLRDWKARVPDPPQGPVHVIELGAGSGRFGHHFLTKLAPRLEAPDLAGLPVRYVMTDLPGGNVDRWRRHPLLRRHVAAGRLDFATLDATRPAAVQLQESGTVLRAGSTGAPIVVVANYVLDSLPLDAFVVEDGSLSEYLVTVTATSTDGGGRGPEMDDLELEWTRRPIGDAPRYRDAELEALLRTVTAGATTRSVLFPTYAVHLLRELRSFTTGPVMFLSADKGYSRPFGRVFSPGPYMATHGSVSFSVDYSVLATYVRRRHGLALLPVHDAASLTVVCFVLDDADAAWPRLTECYRDAVEVGGPDDFFSLDQVLSEHPGLPTLKQLLARLRAAEWDPSVFRRVFPALMARLVGAEEEERWVVLDAVRRVEELYLPIGETADVPFALGMVSWRAGDPAAGLRRLQWSQQLHGADAERSFGMALCHVSAGDLAAAADAVAAAIDHEPEWQLALEFGRWLVSGRAAEEGALGDTTSNWAGALPVYDKWPGGRAVGVPDQ
jgi:Putative S-adenosyl-L-methionine-dependent methyltransferase